jgi:hypothetical protein
MSGKQHIDAEKLTVHQVPEKRNSLQPFGEGVTVVVTQAYGPEGENLIGVSDVKFDGYPAITLRVRVPDGREGLVHLSPIHGDKRKVGFTDIAPGTRCTLLCPASRRPLEKLGPVDDGSGADYYAIYLTPKLSRGDVVMVSDIWDHYHSRVIDDDALISYWASTHPNA